MIFLDGAYWAQCDYIYIAFILGSILFLMSSHYSLSFVFLGIALCIKLQTVFILPAYILYYICNRRFSVLHFLWIPVMYLLGGLPAIIAGRPALEVYRTYLNQTTLYGQLSMNMPNLWRFFPKEWNDFRFWGIALAMIIFLILAFIVFENHYQLTNQTFLLICLCSSGICVMILPGMHERYTALYVLLSYLYFMIYDWKKVLISVLLDLITCITYFHYLYDPEVLQWYPLLAIINLGILYYLIMYTLQKLKQSQ